MLLNPNLTHKMVCYTKQYEKPSLENVWERAGTFKKYRYNADYQINHLSITSTIVVLNQQSLQVVPLRMLIGLVGW